MAVETTIEAAASPMYSERLTSREFSTLMVTASVYFLATGAVNELGGTEAAAGFVMRSAAFSALATRIWFGRTADSLGARRILVIGAGLGAIAFVILAMASSVAGATSARPRRWCSFHAGMGIRPNVCRVAARRFELCMGVVRRRWHVDTQWAARHAAVVATR